MTFNKFNLYNNNNTLEFGGDSQETLNFLGRLFITKEKTLRINKILL